MIRESPLSKRRIVQSASNAVLLAHCREFLRTLPADTEVLILAATRAAADELARACCEGALVGAHRMTPMQAAAALAAPSLGERGLAPVSRLGMEALAARAVHGLRASGGLHYFGPVADTPGFVRALASTLSELRMEGLASDALADAGEPGADLARLLDLYGEEMARHSLADPAVLLATAASRVREGSHALTGLALLLLDAPLESGLEKALLAALVERSPAVLATRLAGDQEGIRALEEALGVEADETPGEGDGALARVRAFLFSPRPADVEESDAGVEFFSAAGEGLECVEMARRIRALAEEGVPFDQVAILLRDPERYQPLVEEALRRAGIPAYFSRGTARPHPAGRAFLALLACAAEGCSASRFAEYLSLGQVPPVDPAGAPRRVERGWVAPDDELLENFVAPPEGASEQEPAPVDEDPSGAVVGGSLRAPAGWEKLLVDAAVIGGRERWARRLRGLEAELELRRQELKEEDEAHRIHLGRQTEQLGHLGRFALPAIELLDALPRRAPWGEWIERLIALAETALREPDSVLAILHELWPMREAGPVELDDVCSVLSERLRFARRRPSSGRYGAVFVGAIEEARGRCFAAVLLPGLAEGIFPRRALEDPLLLDSWRERLPGRLRRRTDRIARERLLLRGAVAAAGSRLVVSYPRLELEQARPRVPSFYALEVLRAGEGKLPELRALELRASQRAPSRLGWPAPQEERHAIDDAEYDLACFGRLLRLPATDSGGLGRYLVEANPHLARSLRTRWRRWEARSWSGADGLVDPSAPALEVLAAHRLARRDYSPTALQQYALCPYRFLLHSVHRFRPREESVALEQMDPLTRGNLFHSAQYEYFQELTRAGLLAFDSWRLPEVLDIADRALDRVARQYEEELAPAIPRVWATEVEGVRTDLRGWIRETVREHADWQPAHFELAFGLEAGAGRRRGRDTESPAAQAVMLDAVRLRGSVDLVEKHRARDLLRVIDHKTGKPPEPAPAVVGGGAFLQPVLYALAVERIFGTAVESGHLYYCTERGDYRRIAIPLDQQARSRIQQVLETIDRAVTEGFLPAAPRKDACLTCDYRPVCGPYEEERARRKDRSRLDALNAVRGLA